MQCIFFRLQNLTRSFRIASITFSQNKFLQIHRFYFHCQSIGVSLFVFLLFFSIFMFSTTPFNNPLSLVSSSARMSFLPTRDKSAPCCDSIARLFRINLAAGINQCASSSVIPEERVPIYILTEEPFDPKKTHRFPLIASPMCICLCVFSFSLRDPKQCVTRIFLP